MPYKEFSKGVKKRTKIYGRAGYQLASDVAYLKTLINSELYVHNLTFSAINITNSGVVYSLSSIAQGDNYGQRTGMSVLPRYLTINMQIKKNMGATAANQDLIRMIVFRYWGEDSNSAGSASVSVADILDNVSPLSMLNVDNTGARGDRERRIQVMRSKLFTLDKVGSTSRTLKINVQMNGKNKKVKEHIKFDTASATEPISGGLYVLLLSDNTSGADYTHFNAQTSLKYHDN